MGKQVDWASLEPQYRAGTRRISDLAEQFGCSDAAIIQHAKREGWSRDLGARIKAKADAKVAAALVAKESPARKLNEAVRVEVEAEVQARLRITHRASISKTREIAEKLLDALENIEITEDSIGKIATLLQRMADTQKVLIAMECEAYGMDKAPEPPANTAVEPVEVARRVAFILARAENELSKAVH